MPFKIVNETYECSPDENPERYGYIEGYTSNTVGETYLRINCKSVVDEEKLDWYKRCYGQIPTTPIREATLGLRSGCRPLQDGDIIGEGVRLSRRQVKQLIKELKLWLKKGY